MARLRRDPRAQIVLCEAVVREFGAQEGLEEVAEALVVFGIDFVVPLLEPRQILPQDGQERGESGGGPAVLFGDLGAICGERSTEFKRVPAGPADGQGRVAVATHVREAHEALLRDVEGAAQAPVRRLQKVRRAVLGRGREIADLFLFAATLLGLESGCVLFFGFFFPSGGRRHLGVDGVLLPL